MNHCPPHGDNLNRVTRLYHKAPEAWIVHGFDNPADISDEPYVSGTEYLYHVRSYIDAAFQHQPELLADKLGRDRREGLWYKEKESWEYLGGGSQVAYVEMHGWVPVIIELTKEDWEVLNEFRGLLQSGNRGYMEATRILAHVFKDKWNSEAQPSRGPSDPDNWSGYFKNAIGESLEAMKVPDWNDELLNLRPYNRRPHVPDQGNWDRRERVPHPRSHGASSSSRYDPGHLRPGAGDRW